MLAGISWGGLIVVQPTLLGAYYGRSSYPLIAGYTRPLSTLVSAIGPLLAGFIYDNTGSYIIAFIVATGLLGIGLVCAFLARPPKLQISERR